MSKRGRPMSDSEREVAEVLRAGMREQMREALEMQRDRWQTEAFWRQVWGVQ